MDWHRSFIAVLLWYGLWSAVAFIAYALDKSAARQGRWRTSENTLHFLALVGGWPGAWFAAKLLRHKSRKSSFRLTFWSAVVMNSVLLCAALWLIYAISS